jgi:hypothetical protein
VAERKGIRFLRKEAYSDEPFEQRQRQPRKRRGRGFRLKSAAPSLVVHGSALAGYVRRTKSPTKMKFAIPVREMQPWPKPKEPAHARSRQHR